MFDQYNKTMKKHDFTQIKISGCMLSIEHDGSDKQNKSNWDITSDDPFILSHSH